MKNNKNKIGVSVDAINHVENDIFRVRLIPDYNSEYHIPLHTRNVLVKRELLEKSYLDWINEYHNRYADMIAFQSEDVTNSISQGGYYILNKKDFNEKLRFEGKIVFDRENNLFEERSNSPYNESNIIGERFLNAIDIEELSICSNKNMKNDTYLYSFNVGQGDMSLLITSEKNAYLIDTNLYEKNFCAKVNEIENILEGHNMDKKKIKGLIITHKHLDHIRGAYKLIDKFEFENFIINLDYIHSNSIVEELFKTARIKIPTWINLNQPCKIIEGNTRICFRNPNENTHLAPDINDSSIVMSVSHGDNRIYLTGDACASVLLNSFDCCGGINNMLKVSHHGSRTGTDCRLIHKIIPSEAFISVGSSRKYRHPHKEVVDMLKNFGSNIIISKNVKRTIEYRLSSGWVDKRIV